MSKALEAMLAQYEKNNTPTYTKNENAVPYDPNNYFGTFLEKGKNSATKTVRILPTEDGSSPFIEMTGHKTQVNGDWKTFACLKAEKGTDCPFCEAREALLASGTDSDKELAKKYNTKKMYIVKVIDRDNEAHGPKFWRFNHDYRKTGVLDKIFGLLKIAKDITSADNGRDLQITIARDQNGNPVIQSIVNYDPSPLSTDEAQAKAWLADTKVWQDVYSIKNYEYLEIVVKGEEPVWDKEAKKFVGKESQAAALAGVKVEALDSELSMGVQAVKPAITVAAPAAAAVVTAPAEEDEDTDLPF